MLVTAVQREMKKLEKQEAGMIKGLEKIGPRIKDKKGPWLSPGVGSGPERDSGGVWWGNGFYDDNRRWQPMMKEDRR